MLRIEDTDQERFMEGALDIIYRTLADAGLVHDEGPDKDGGVGPYVQSERNARGIYLKYARQLVEQGDAYYCFCDKERLDGLKTTVAGKEIVSICPPRASPPSTMRSRATSPSITRNWTI